MVKYVLLRGERTHAVAEQDDPQGAVRRVRVTGKLRHIGDQTVPSGRAEIAEQFLFRGGAAVTAMIVGIDVKARAIEIFREGAVAQRMLAHPVGDLNEACRGLWREPSIARERDSIGGADKRKFLTHNAPMDIANHAAPQRRELCPAFTTS